jgi:putative ABC transport system ATP-binding protein
MLILENINITFDNNNILKNISCSVDKGDFIVIVGGNGAGKSTFFDTIAGKNIPNSGKIILNNKDITQLNESNRAKYIARIFQNTNLNSIGTLTVLENLAISQLNNKKTSFNSGTSRMPFEKALELINIVGLPEQILNTKMNQLSGGQRQLIAFIMVSQLTPQLLLLDEPTAALDPQASTKLLFHTTEFIKKNNTTTLLITHDPYIAINMGNKLWILENGAIIKQYSEEEKKNIIDPSKLIGQIDYQLLKSIQ